MVKHINTKSSFTLIETLIGIIVLCLTLQLFQVILLTSQRYITELKDITPMQWWVASHQLEKSLQREQYKECSPKTTNTKVRGIYFISRHRLMVHRPYKNEFVRSRQMKLKHPKPTRNYWLAGYVPLLLEVKDIDFYEKDGYLYFKGQFENGKKYESSWRIVDKVK